MIGISKVFGDKVDLLKAKSVIKRICKVNSKDTFTKSVENVIPQDLQNFFDKNPYLNRINKKYLTDLHTLGADKFKFIIGHKGFGTNSPCFCDKPFVTSLKKMSKQEISKTFDEVDELYSTLPKVGYEYNEATKEIIYSAQKPIISDYARLLILKAHNKEAYEYIMKNQDKKSISDLLRLFQGRLEGSAFETLTVPQIRQIQQKGISCTLDREIQMRGCAAENKYVESSDTPSKNDEDVATLHQYLSGYKVIEPFTAYRGERDTGMFSSIVLDKSLAKKTKLYVLKNFLKARKLPVHDYTGNYETYFAKKQNLFKFIMSRSELTLADAMQVAKYGDAKYQKEIIELIKKAKIEDTRFKSLTFDKGMAHSWLPTSGSNNTGILQTLRVNTGIEGKYSSVDNMQAEFILNNNPKLLTFQDVQYFPEKDIWKLNSNISSL